MVVQNSLNNRNLDIRNNGQLIEDLTESVEFNKDFTVTQTQDAFVDVELKFHSVFVSSDYTVQREDTFVGVDTSAGRITITLFEGQENDRLIIKDTAGQARPYEITVLPSGSDDIDGHDEIKLKIKYIGIQFLYTNGSWRLV